MDTFLETIWFSKKRKSLLFLLLQGPKNAEEIEDTLKISWKSLLLPIKELKEVGLILNINDMYSLTNVGKLLTENAKTVSDLIELLDNNIEYWSTRDLENIPDEFLRKIGDLKEVCFIEPELTEMFDLPLDLINCLEKATYVITILSIFHPQYFSIFKDKALEEANLSLIVTKGVLERIETDFLEDFKKLRQTKNTQLFVYQDGFLPPTIILTDHILFLSIFEKKGFYDHKYILSFNPQSFKWAEKLYSHYLFYSKKYM